MVDFIGIGVQKGGTTWLYRQLSRHPQVSFPMGKEAHFWDRGDLSRSSEWSDRMEPSSRVSDTGLPVRSGEITPAYAILPVETLRLLRGTCPGVRLFISLRNPMERAWSAAWMARARAELLPDEASDAWFIDHFRSSGSRRRGAYARCLQAWWSVFPRESLKVVFQDDIRSKPRSVLQDLARHIGVEEGWFDQLAPDDLAETLVPNIEIAFDQAPGDLSMRPALVSCLRDLYAREIEELGPLVGRDLRHWIQEFPAASPRGSGRRVEVVVRGRPLPTHREPAARP